MQAYFEDHNATPLGALITNILVALFGIGSLVVVHQILTGWIALGERANISRRDLNATEWIIAIGAALLAVMAFRTAWGIYTRQEAGWVWTQWLSLIALLIGFGMGMSTVLGSTQDNVTFDTPLFVTGLVVFVLAVGVYRYSTLGAETTPEEYFRVQLAESPSAGAIIGFMVVFLGFSMATPLFLEPTSIASVLTNNSTKGIIAIGITILMISGEFDLSVGSVLGATSMFFLIGMTEGYLGFIGPQPVVVAAICALLFASLLGLINGIIFTLSGIPSFIVTLGTLFAYRAISLVTIGGGRILRYKDYYEEFPIVAINRWILIIGAIFGLFIVLFVAYEMLPGYWKNFTRKWSIRHNGGSFGTSSALVSGFWALVVSLVLAVVGLWLILVAYFHLEHLGNPVRVGTFDIINGRWAFTLHEVTQGAIRVTIPTAANFRMSILWWLILVVVFQIILTNTRYGNAVFAVGGNIGAARAQGIPASRIKVQNFVLCSFLAGVASILEVTRNPGVDPLSGDTWELQVIAMTVIGGALLTGGYGSIIGTMLGVLIFGMLQTGLVLVGMDARMFQGVVGVIMIIAVVLNNITKRTR